MNISRDSVLDWLKACASILEESRDYLTELDSAIGDADHGANMDRGFKAVLSKLPEVVAKDIGSIFKTTGMALVSTVGGAAGPLYGTFFLQAGVVAAGKTELAPGDWVASLDAGVKGVINRGKAGPGDKTMLDALLPALEAARAALAGGKTLEQVLSESAAAARKGAEDTIPIVARRGRASYLGERSAGHRDPGATSASMILTAAADVFGKAKG
ncbi:MAG: dihydroxyacetone kinase subunit L [Firmicutes bacterium]|nr:dihydroxyacetone kinase subunit L [Bacillota bacterium]